MATEVEAEVAVAAPEESEANSAGETTQQEKKKGWLRRRSTKQEENKSKKPPDNKWLQQQIPACRPVFTAKHVFGVFVTIGLIFLALGIVFLVTTLQLDDVEVSYDGCAPTNPEIPSEFNTCDDYLESVEDRSNTERRDLADCQCTIQFDVPETLQAPWYLYYSLGNYYQNHRRYVNSWDVEQLRGDDIDSPGSDCMPLERFGGDPVVPCGLIANSLFNDTFDTFTNLEQSDINFTCCDTNNIAWKTDREVRFQNPGGDDEIDPARLVGTTMPPNWVRNLSEIENGLENEQLIVWFRVSAFPKFRKLYGRLIIDGSNDADLPKGRYSVNITYNYPVSSFNGRKYLVLAEVSWLGGRNLFLGIAYIITGVFAVIVGVVLLLVHIFCSRWKITDKDFLNRKY